MKCVRTYVDGQPVIICGNLPARTCVKQPCNKIATRLCDWKIGGDRTCDAAVCDDHAYSPAPDKDLCPTHRAMWEERRAKKAASQEGSDG